MLLASGCGPRVSIPEKPIATEVPPTPVVPRYRRTGPQGNGQSTGAIARIGAALSLTGSAAVTGQSQRAGIKLAQDEINTNRVLGSTRLDVIIEDDASDRDQAAAVFQKFIDNSHAVAIIGPTLSDTALTVDPLAQEAGVPVLAISNAAGGLTQIGNYIFRDALSESQLAPQIIKQVCARFKLHNAALLYTNTDPNRTGSHGFKAALQDAGVNIVAETSFQPDAGDLSSQLQEIAAARPDAVFVTAPGGIGATVLVQARQAGLENVPIIGSNAFNSAGLVSSAGAAAEGLIVGSAWNISNPSPRNLQFADAYRARYGGDPDQFAAQAYTGVYILAAALQDAGTVTDSHALRDALERVHLADSPLGPFSFNDARDAAYAPIVQIVRNGVFQPF
jgi:branched-chain amino acid transport system substrate-binding protein